NQDVFDIFTLAKNIFQLKNLFSGLAPEAFLGPSPGQGCIARIAAQFYPAGAGMLNQHSDPVDYHQLTVPTLMLSQKGKDFHQGGDYFVNEDRAQIALDNQMNFGEVVFFNAQVPHGVAPVDPDQPLDWLAFQGRWILLFAVNKVVGNETISASVDHQTTGKH